MRAKKDNLREYNTDHMIDMPCDDFVEESPKVIKRKSKSISRHTYYEEEIVSSKDFTRWYKESDDEKLPVNINLAIDENTNIPFSYEIRIVALLKTIGTYHNRYFSSKNQLLKTIESHYNFHPSAMREFIDSLIKQGLLTFKDYKFCPSDKLMDIWEAINKKWHMKSNGRKVKKPFIRTDNLPKYIRLTALTNPIYEINLEEFSLMCRIYEFQMYFHNRGKKFYAGRDFLAQKLGSTPNKIRNIFKKMQLYFPQMFSKFEGSNLEYRSLNIINIPSRKKWNDIFKDVILKEFGKTINDVKPLYAHINDNLWRQYKAQISHSKRSDMTLAEFARILTDNMANIEEHTKKYGERRKGFNGNKKPRKRKCPEDKIYFWTTKKIVWEALYFDCKHCIECVKDLINRSKLMSDREKKECMQAYYDMWRVFKRLCHDHYGALDMLNDLKNKFYDLYHFMNRPFFISYDERFSKGKIRRSLKSAA